MDANVARNGDGIGILCEPVATMLVTGTEWIDEENVRAFTNPRNPRLHASRTVTESFMMEVGMRSVGTSRGDRAFMF